LSGTYLAETATSDDGPCSQGTSIIGLFGAAAAWTGASEKTLKRIGEKDYEKIYSTRIHTRGITRAPSRLR
jgi:hypothetical protein